MDILKLMDYGLFSAYNNLGMYKPGYDVQENDEEIILSIGIPGLREEDVDVIVKNDRKLIVKSKRASKFTADFSCMFSIPVKVNKKETYATVHDGVLEVHLKKDESSEFKIQIK